MTIALHVAASPPEACAQIAKLRHATVIAGGTLVMNALNTDDIATTTLIDLDKLGLRKIKVAASQVTLGATTTMSDIAMHPKLRFLTPVARAIGGPAVRNMATVGGNLHAPTPYGDFGAALLALDATVTIETARQRKALSLENFYKDRGKLGPYILTSVSFKLPAKDSFLFVKAIRRKPVSAAILSIAAHLPLKAGKFVAPRIALGAMAPVPIRAKAVEAALESQPSSAATIEKAVLVACDECLPASDAYASAWYRREILPVYLARLLAGRNGRTA